MRSNGPAFLSIVELLWLCQTSKWGGGLQSVTIIWVFRVNSPKLKIYNIGRNYSEQLNLGIQSRSAQSKNLINSQIVKKSQIFYKLRNSSKDLK